MVAALGLQPAAAASAGRSSAHHPRPSSTPAGAQRSPALAGLSITVSDGRTRVRPGDQVSYVVRVTDGGAAAAPHLKITLTMPAYLKLSSASQQAKTDDGQVTWRSDLAPGKAVVFRARALLVRVPHGLARLAAVACATGASGSPTICASHLDALPGASHTGTVTSSRTAAGTAGGTRTGYVATGLIVLTVAALLAFAASRLRSRRTRRWRHRHSG